MRPGRRPRAPGELQPAPVFPHARNAHTLVEKHESGAGRRRIVDQVLGPELAAQQRFEPPEPRRDERRRRELQNLPAVRPAQRRAVRAVQHRLLAAAFEHLVGAELDLDRIGPIETPRVVARQRRRQPADRGRAPQNEVEFEGLAVIRAIDRGRRPWS